MLAAFLAKVRERRKSKGKKRVTVSILRRGQNKREDETENKVKKSNISSSIPKVSCEKKKNHVVPFSSN